VPVLDTAGALGQVLGISALSGTSSLRVLSHFSDGSTSSCSRGIKPRCDGRTPPVRRMIRRETARNPRARNGQPDNRVLSGSRRGRAAVESERSPLKQDVTPVTRTCSGLLMAAVGIGVDHPDVVGPGYVRSSSRPCRSSGSSCGYLQPVVVGAGRRSSGRSATWTPEPCHHTPSHWRRGSPRHHAPHLRALERRFAGAVGQRDGPEYLCPAGSVAASTDVSDRGERAVDRGDPHHRRNATWAHALRRDVPTRATGRASGSASK